MPGPNDHHVVLDPNVPTGHRLEAGLGADEPAEELRRGAARVTLGALKKMREDAAADIKAAQEITSKAAFDRAQLEKERADFEMEKANYLAERGATKPAKKE